MHDLSNVVFIHPDSAAPGAGEPSAPPAADPIFAAIDRLRAAEARHANADARRDAARKEGRGAAADAGEARAVAELRAEEDSFLSTVPLTIAGLRAGLAYAFEFDADGYQLRPFVESILRSPVWALAPADALAAAIERHRSAVRQVAAHSGRDDLPAALTAAEDAALHELAVLPCDDAAFLAKLRHMVADQKRRWGSLWRSRGAPEIMTALELHLFGEA